MPCPCGSFQLSSCAPFANRDDVINALKSVDQVCCVGEVSVNTDSPASSDANAVSASQEAFPDGVDSCNCPCTYIFDTVNDRTYINCTDNLTLASNWKDITESCIGVLSTVALDPSLTPVASNDEAFPLGISKDCNNVIIFTEDGSICHSKDRGVSYSCLSATVTGVDGRATTLYQSSVLVNTIMITVPLALDTLHDPAGNVLVHASDKFELDAGTYETVGGGVPFWNLDAAVGGNVYFYLYDFNAALAILDIDGVVVRTVGASVHVQSANNATWLQQNFIVDGTESIGIVGVVSGAGFLASDVRSGFGASNTFPWSVSFKRIL